MRKVAQAKFRRTVGSWANKVKTSGQTVAKWMAFRLHARIKELTPVDTGRARASWNLVSGEVAHLTVAEVPVKGEKVPDPGTPFVRNANAYTISNNLPYIKFLEEGSSKQAPAGMVKVAIAEVRAEARVKLR